MALLSFFIQKKDQHSMKVYLITIGDELLIGQTVDTNSAWMARLLNLSGAEIIESLTIGDDEQAILDALSKASDVANVVLITGGLGPTKDDITKKALANFFQDEMRFDEPTFERIQKLFQRWGRSMTPAHRDQCYMPASATLLLNKMGTAPGMWFEREGKVYVSMPGVPYEMEYLMEHEVVPRLVEHFPGQPIEHRTLQTVGEGESRIAVRLEDFEAQLPDFVKLAFLPNLGKVRLRLTGRHSDHEMLKRLMDDKADEMEALIPELVFGREQDSLEAAIGKLLMKHQLRLGTAESCTGGYIAHQITSVAGSSNYYEGSIVSYSNEMKQNLLGVQAGTLERYGAVSEQTVREMAEGALRAIGCDISISISGIAGPGGGSEEKPVGTVWIGVSNGTDTETFLLHAGKDRLKNIQYSAVHALDRLRRFVLKHYQETGAVVS